MTSHHLTPDTQAILLLCASFGQSRVTDQPPLSLKEYNSFAHWLHGQKFRPADVLTTQGKDIIASCDCLEPLRLQVLLERGMMLAIAVENWTNQGLWILGRGDQLYPTRLRKQLGVNAPPILYGVGDTSLLSQGGLAVVGSRDVDEEGIAYTIQVADSCARQGIQIVSGGARGVDTTAMLAALAEGGTAIGVLADSLAKSATASKYRSAIQNQQLTLISAVDPQARFNVGNAMGRNKYIYGLADYGLVVSSDYNKGGTWAGALEALKQEKSIPIFVRTEGEISEGNKQLLKRTARQFPHRPWINNFSEKLAESASVISVPESVQGSLLLSDSSNILIKSSPQLDNYQQQVSEEKIVLVNSSEQKVIDIPLSVYEAVLPLILNILQQPLDDRSLAQALDVNLTQLKIWLKKAIHDGRVIKKNRPVRYISIDSSH
jgi:predicted Rossmann fold nucleotide-binding protein DprA/Smf involved in DNA uptake